MVIEKRSKFSPNFAIFAVKSICLQLHRYGLGRQAGVCPFLSRCPLEPPLKSIELRAEPAND